MPIQIFNNDKEGIQARLEAIAKQTNFGTVTTLSNATLRRASKMKPQELVDWINEAPVFTTIESDSPNT